MRRRGYLPAVILCLIAGRTTAQSNPGIRVHMHGDTGYAADGLLYKPTVTERHAALLLIPDERGITQRVTDAATAFVDAGYVVVAVDLNRGLPADSATRSDEQVDHDLKSALAFVCAQANVQSDKVGFVGWGSGGVAALRVAGDGKIRAVAVADEAPLSAYAKLAATQAAILGSLAGHGKLEARLHQLGRSAEVTLYPDAVSGFDDPDDSVHFKAAAAADIQARQLQFFAAQLH